MTLNQNFPASIQTKPKPVPSGNKRIIGYAAMRHQEARTEFLGFENGTRWVIARLAARLCDHPAHQQVALKLVARALDGARRDQKAGHRPLIVANTLSDQEIIFAPGRMINVAREVLVHQIVGARRRRVHVAVEDEAVAAA